MADALDSLDALSGHIAALAEAADSGRSKNVDGAKVRPIARALATTYFECIRPELDLVKSRAGLVEEIDFVIQSILQLANGPREKQAYVEQLNELRPYVLQATVDLMKAKGTPRLVLSQTERSILDTLRALLPASASAYEQALRDIAQGGRVSWRGTATELREVLRDVVDHLAPDDKVSTAAGFRLEPGQARPTQKQKVRYILKARRSSSTAVTVAEASLDTIEEAIAGLARSTYQRGSASAHVGTTSNEIKSLKRYVDALLGEILEIN